MALQMPCISWNPEHSSADERQLPFDNDFILRLVTSFDSVFFDFSDWSVDELNESTSAFFGVPSGSLSISWSNFGDGKAVVADQPHNTVISADSSDSGTYLQPTASPSSGEEKQGLFMLPLPSRAWGEC